MTRTLPEMMAAAEPLTETGRPSAGPSDPTSSGERPARTGAPEEAVTAYDHLWFRGRPLT